MRVLVAALLLSFTYAQPTGGANMTGGEMTGGSNSQMFGGVVFEDGNGNGERDDGEPGVASVAVSNGVDVVQTNEEGRYQLPVRDEMVVFVSKPEDYMVALDENQVPQFSYVHRPEGSPEFIREYDGIAPTGSLPDSVDFALTRAEEPDEFRFIVFGDTQVTTHEELNYLRDTVVAELSDSDARFAVAVGDLLNDPLHLFGRYQEVMGTLPFPTYFLPGNHDINFDSTNDEYHLETYTRHFGSPYYSFDYGQTHFVVFDNICYNVDEGFEGTYNGRISDAQLEWFANGLEYVDPNKLIVLSMHIALSNYVDRDAEKHQETRRERIYQVLEEGGFENVISLAGHSHTLERMRPGETYNPGTVANDDGEEEASFGWGTVPFPQFVAGAVCGSWWSGVEDPTNGVPTSTMRCGAPKGYMVFDVSGNSYSEYWKPSGSDAAMHVGFDMPQTGFSASDRGVLDELGVLTTTELQNNVTVVANVYAGGRDTEVTMRLDDGPEVAMTWDQEQRDPVANRLQATQDSGGRLTEAGMSYHLYTATLPDDIEPGVHTLTVRAVDPYGQEWSGSKVFDVWRDSVGSN